MATCPHGHHDPGGFSSSWMWIYQCRDCGKHFWHDCGTNTSSGVRCAQCNADDTFQDYECHSSSDDDEESDE
jgi:DNA-directed RNA polymerase subunit RPC12/RpoP